MGDAVTGVNHVTYFGARSLSWLVRLYEVLKSIANLVRADFQICHLVPLLLGFTRFCLVDLSTEVVVSSLMRVEVLPHLDG